MKPRSEDSGAEWLLQHASWIRELARALVGDGRRAEDLAQDTLVAALEHRPSTDRPLRPWLGTVLRNLARKADRRQGASPVRGSRSAADGVSELPGPEEVCEQLETERLLTEELARLEEPIRRIVFLRFYHGLSPKEIARRLELPGGTVRWRLKRGLDVLRARLDERCGDRRAWCLLLFPVAWPEEAAATGVAGSSVVITGALAMNTVLKTGVAAATLVIAFLGLAVTGVLPDPMNPFVPTEAPLEVAFRPIRPEPVAAGARPAAAAPASIAGRHTVPPPKEAAAAIEQGKLLAPAVVEAVISDLAGNALAGASLREVKLDGPGRSAVGGGGGSVRLELDAGEGGRGVRLEAGLPGFTSRSETARILPGETVHLGRLALAPGGAVSGRVIDEDGRGLAGVRITAGELERDRRSLEQIRFGVPEVSIPACWSDEQGRFVLSGLGDGFVRVWGRAEGRLPSWTPPIEVRDGEESYGVELVLRRIGDANRIRGVVLDPDGVPVPFAQLEFFHRSARGGLGLGDEQVAKADGSFELVMFEDARLAITARDPEHRYGPAAAEGIPAGEQNLVLQLVEGERVRLLVFGADGEALDRFELEVLPVDEDNLPSELQALPVLGPEPGFLVPDRPYHVRITAPLHEIETLGPFLPGDERETLEVHLSAVPGLHGRVFAAAEPVAGARATLHRLVPPGELYERNGFRCWQEVQALDEAGSDEAGRFLLTPREAGGYVVRIEKEGHAPAELGPFRLGPDLEAGPFELHLGRGGAIEGQVHLPRYEDPTGTIVAAHRGDGRPRTVRVGPDGAFRFTGLTPGPWRVEEREQESLRVTTITTAYASRSFESEVKWNCEVREGETTWFDLRSKDAQAHVVKGRLMLDGEPGVGWLAWLSPADTLFLYNIGQHPTSRLDSAGRFELTTAEPGEYWVSVKRIGEGVESVFGRRVHLRAAETEVAFEVETGTLVIEDYEMKPLIEGDDVPSLVYIWSDGDDLFGSWFAPDEEGTCTLEGVPAGQGRLARPSLERMLDPMSWEVALSVRILPGKLTRVSAP